MNGRKPADIGGGGYLGTIRKSSSSNIIDELMSSANRQVPANEVYISFFLSIIRQIHGEWRR